MKKTILSLLIAATALASCSSDDDNTPEAIDLLNPKIENRWTGTNAELWDVTNQYVSQMVFPTYKALAEASEKLFEKSKAIQSNYKSGSLTNADIQAACAEFENARYFWERSEAFLYGAASDFNIDPHIDSWPLDQEQMAQFFASPAMISGLNSADPIAFVSSHNAEFDTALGFHGIEYILYRDGSARPASALDENEIAFLAAVSGDLRDHCFQLEVSWLGEAAPAAHKDRVAALGMSTRAMGNHGYHFGADLLLAGYSNHDTRYHSTTYASPTAVVANILVGGCSNICAEVADQKMGQAWRVLNGNGSAEDAGDYIESPYSKHSFIDYQGNIFSIAGSLCGGLSYVENIENSRKFSKTFENLDYSKHSILAFLKAKNYPGTPALQSSLAQALSALQECINSGVAFVDDPGNPRVKTAIDAVTALDDELNFAAQWIEKQ